MRKHHCIGAFVVASALLLKPALAAEMVEVEPYADPPLEQFADVAWTEGAAAETRMERLLEDALRLVGIRYRRGGSDEKTGFDCSGFVRYVFHEAMGLALPRTSREISREGEPVAKSDLQPGDLVFFNTMRRAFSHVGIYVGDNQFIHAPRSGRAVRVESMTGRYWSRRYNGARRIDAR